MTWWEIRKIIEPIISSLTYLYQTLTLNKRIEEIENS